MKLSYVYFLALSMVVLLFVGAVACVRASNFDIPIADVTYGVGGDYPDWEGTLEINRNLTVKVSGLTHENTESGDAAIRICEGATVNLVFEGENVLYAREAATTSNHIPTEVYDVLLEQVHKNLPLLHRYVKLRKKILGVDELHILQI